MKKVLTVRNIQGSGYKQTKKGVLAMLLTDYELAVLEAVADEASASEVPASGMTGCTWG